METGTVHFWDYSKPIKERHAGSCGPYYFKRGKLRDKGDKCEGFAGYLSASGHEVSEGAVCRLRVRLARDIANFRHKGWYTDDSCAQTMEGVVALLPSGRGFLAGWTMGTGMITSFAGYIYDDIEDAAQAADQEAQSAAEKEREYQELKREREDEEERLMLAEGTEESE